MMKQRIGYGTLLILAIAGLLWLDTIIPVPGLIVLAICFVLAIAGFREYCVLVRAQGYRPMFKIGVVAIIGLYVLNGLTMVAHAAWLSNTPHSSNPAWRWFDDLLRLLTDHRAISRGQLQVPAAWWLLVVAALMVRAAFARLPKPKPADAALTLLGLVVIPVALLYIPAVRITFGLPLLVALLVITKINDIAAYFCGAAFGRHHPFPTLSPKKSVEGYIGGAIASVAAGAVYGWIAFNHNATAGFSFHQAAGFWIHMAIGAALGLIVGTCGQLGDLLESYLKRQSEIKDSGNVVPTFGGVLDMIDSPLLAMPVAYLLMQAFARQTDWSFAIRF